jgi:hypothetical protein
MGTPSSEGARQQAMVLERYTMTRRFGITEAVTRAIQALFGDVRTGLALLEVPDDDVREKAGDSAASRAMQLRDSLEGYIVNMAREVEELGPSEAERLRAEARATLIALRELFARFPEVAREP